MVTRFYPESTGSGVLGYGDPPISPGFDAAWGDTDDAVRRWLSHSGAQFSTPLVSEDTREVSATNPIDVLGVQLISARLAAQTISGTVKGQIRTSEENADADYRAQVVIRVVSEDGSSVIGTLLAADGSALSSEFAVTTLTNRKFPLAAVSPATLSSLAVSEGDRIVVEIGNRSHNSHTTNRQALFNLGSAPTTDLAEDETTTTANRPWIEFSDDITFANEIGRTTQALVEAVVTSTAPRARATQAYIEVVASRKVEEAGWGTRLA